jgi:hypothetical protein
LGAAGRPASASRSSPCGRAYPARSPATSMQSKLECYWLPTCTRSGISLLPPSELQTHAELHCDSMTGSLYDLRASWLSTGQSSVTISLDQQISCHVHQVFLMWLHP